MDPNAVPEEHRTERTVLLLGGTGRTGSHVLRQLLKREVNVLAIVRSTARLPKGVADNPRLTAIEADLLSLKGEALRPYLEGCDTVISCLGHTTTVKGIFGPPVNLVARAVASFARTAVAVQRAEPVRFILMSSVTVNQPARADAHRGAGERLFLSVLRGLLPPAKDNQRAADFFAHDIGPGHGAIEWVAVRPDTLVDGDVTEYSLSSELVSSLFRPAKTNMANVAHFMCELATDDSTWTRWKGRMPVIVNGMEESSS